MKTAKSKTEQKKKRWHRRWHRWMGMVMLLPFIAWALTGVLFLVRPGFSEAYEPLAIKHYPLERLQKMDLQPDWLELRQIKSILGEHVLIRLPEGWQQWDPEHNAPRAMERGDLRALVEDAMSENTARYGRIESMMETDTGARIMTDRGAVIQLDWAGLRLSQEGRDTRIINLLYEIHYLRWTGIGWLDRILGLAGLALLMLMTVTGALLIFKRPKQKTAGTQASLKASLT